MTNPPYALILAGGSGERFWPLSRRARPKQLLKLVSDKTLLEETIDRLAGLVPDERILVLTNVDQEAAVRELLPDLPPENILAEPAKRDTAAAVALATAWVAARDHRATMMVLPADHVINDRAAFQETMQTATRAAEDRCAGHDWDQANLGLPSLATSNKAPRLEEATPNDVFGSFAFAPNSGGRQLRPEG
jgi:mannose-1-phosphate guanylyltransferase